MDPYFIFDTRCFSEVGDGEREINGDVERKRTERDQHIDTEKLL